MATTRTNKVYVLAPGENWIVDRFVKEWNVDNADISVQRFNDADVIWLLSDWCWERVPYDALRSKPVITTVHHIVPEKFNAQELTNFQHRDAVTDAYHVYNQRTLDFIHPLTEKPIHLIPYWANDRIWRPTDDRIALRKKHGLPLDAFIIGSFQRDTEGHDLASPKLEKGPDLLADFIATQVHCHDMLHVLLAGWRRQYIISRLQDIRVPFTYIERPPHEVVNELYQTLDLYPVTARTEGGPQSLIECGLLNVPVVSRPVGIAEQVLPQSAIADDVSKAAAAVPNVDAWRLPAGYAAYRSLIEHVASK